MKPKKLAQSESQPIADVQGSADKRRIPIDKVGIKNILHPVRVKDRNGGEQHTIATFNMYVNLPRITSYNVCYTKLLRQPPAGVQNRCGHGGYSGHGLHRSGKLGPHTAWIEQLYRQDIAASLPYILWTGLNKEEYTKSKQDVQ